MMMTANAQGTDIMLGVNANLLWGNSTLPGGVDHEVMVGGFTQELDGSIRVIINDTGANGGNGRTWYLTVDRFFDILNGSMGSDMHWVNLPLRPPR